MKEVSQTASGIGAFGKLQLYLFRQLLEGIGCGGCCGMHSEGGHSAATRKGNSETITQKCNSEKNN
jgi:hypothetical protein